MQVPKTPHPQLRTTWSSSLARTQRWQWLNPSRSSAVLGLSTTQLQHDDSMYHRQLGVGVALLGLTGITLPCFCHLMRPSYLSKEGLAEVRAVPLACGDPGLNGKLHVRSFR